ncbi:flagellum transition zone component [Trypanosoma grayi]|uniref:flagellum transition zone component n=1 Tax=Trypanosoma grayi TaxID=71804 RepID=UPI0004F4AB2F|nr:flagellum transition zone component [Trypanosoma grayi]KEG13051.1 flagellum transition zone component [Trypanosoma grayi]
MGDISRDPHCPCNRPGFDRVAPRHRRSRSVSASKAARDVGAPYREPRSKRLRDQVVDARDAFSADERVFILTRDRNECKAELREKNEQMKKLEVTVRALRAHMVRNMAKERDSVLEDEGSSMDPEMKRLVDENMELERRLREANMQIMSWKRDARVAQLQELKAELAVYRAEVTRLSSLDHSAREKDIRRACMGSRLREALEVAQDKDNVIQKLKDELAENALALRRSLDDAMRANSTVEQLQEENDALCKELCVLRKTTLLLTQTREELECTRGDLTEAKGRLREFERVMEAVGGPAEVLVVINERDALLGVLKEQSIRHEAQRREFVRLQREANQDLEMRLQEALQQERALAKDKEAQLQRASILWKERHEHLALETTAEKNRLEKQIKTLKENQEQRQQELRVLLSSMQLQQVEGAKQEASPVQGRYSLHPENAPASTVSTMSPTSVAPTSSLSASSSTPLMESSSGGNIEAGGNPLLKSDPLQECPSRDVLNREGTLSHSDSTRSRVKDVSLSSSTEIAHALQGHTAATGAPSEEEVSMVLTRNSTNYSVTKNSTDDKNPIRDENSRQTDADLPLFERTIVPPTTPPPRECALPPAAAVPLPPTGSGLASVAKDGTGNDTDSERSLPVRVQVPPPPAAAVPLPPRGNGLASVAKEESDSDTDSEGSLPGRVQVPPSPARYDHAVGMEGRDSAGVSALSVSTLSGGGANLNAPRSRYQEDGGWEIDSPVDEDESFTVHHVQH